jgi:hypothetical protein
MGGPQPAFFSWLGRLPGATSARRRPDLRGDSTQRQIAPSKRWSQENRYPKFGISGDGARNSMNVHGRP